MMYVDTILGVRDVVNKIFRNVIPCEAYALERESRNLSIIYTKLCTLEKENS